MTETRRQVVTTGLLVAFVTLASGLVGQLGTSSGVLWVLVFAAVCYPAFRATHREGAGRGSAGAGRAGAGAGREGAGSAQPWRAEVVAGVLSLVGCLLVVPLVAGGGLTAYLLAAVVVLAVYLLSAWWFG